MLIRFYTVLGHFTQKVESSTAHIRTNSKPYIDLFRIFVNCSHLLNFTIAVQSIILIDTDWVDPDE